MGENSSSEVLTVENEHNNSCTKVKLSNKELPKRKKKWKPKKIEYNSGTLWKYAQTVGPAYLGAPTHPGKKKEVKEYSKI